jgi:chromosome segregation ATPase
MNKQDIDKASAALTGAISYFSPMVVALNQADEVFSVLSNAIKLKASIEKEIDALKEILGPFQAQIDAGKAAVKESEAAATEAKAQAEKDIAEAKAQADAEVKSIKAGVADRTKKSVADAEAKIAEANAAAQQAKTQYENNMALMATAKAALQADVDKLETKLASLREQAKKFAASLVE